MQASPCSVARPHAIWAQSRSEYSPRRHRTLVPPPPDPSVGDDRYLLARSPHQGVTLDSWKKVFSDQGTPGMSNGTYGAVTWEPVEIPSRGACDEEAVFHICKVFGS